MFVQFFMARKQWAALVCLLLFATACAKPDAPKSETEIPDAPLRTGAEVLVASAFDDFKGKRVGLLVNHTARVAALHLSDVFHNSADVTLTALFGPEHGIRGEADAGEKIEDGIDMQTGVPVFSLYGETRKPTLASLEGLDALVFDIQDIGARFYTFISSMGLAMQAAAEAGIPFIVLDRPNPLGGEYVAGYIREPAYSSFVGQYPIPVTHGMTVGELALMIKGEAFLDGLETLDLRVVKMEGWKRSMNWLDTGREWRPTSPNIPDFETALLYPGMCYFEAVEASEGRGTRTPFRLVGAPWIDSDKLIEALEGMQGVAFEPASFSPESIDGMAANPRFKGEALQGIKLTVTDAHAIDPVATGIHVLAAFYAQAPETLKASFFKERWMNLLGGTEKLRLALEAGTQPEDIVAGWGEDVAAFKAARAPYLLYD